MLAIRVQPAHHRDVQPELEAGVEATHGHGLESSFTAITYSTYSTANWRRDSEVSNRIRGP